MSIGPKIQVRNPNVPDFAANVDAAQYEAMKAVILRVLPRKAPGYTQREMFDAVRAAVDVTVFPRSTYTWWAKTVQLDLEAKGLLVRTAGPPARWHKA